MKLRPLFLAVFAALALASAAPVTATVLTGPLTDVLESEAQFCWGDGTHDLCQMWAYMNANSGWFFGLGLLSNASVHVEYGLADPTTVTNAESFAYPLPTRTKPQPHDLANEGDTVFFRGSNGYYGAWKITRIDPITPNPYLGVLTGQWYFQTNGTGCFAPTCGATPVARGTWGSLKVMYR